MFELRVVEGVSVEGFLGGLLFEEVVADRNLRLVAGYSWLLICLTLAPCSLRPLFNRFHIYVNWRLLRRLKLLLRIVVYFARINVASLAMRNGIHIWVFDPRHPQMSVFHLFFLFGIKHLQNDLLVSIYVDVLFSVDLKIMRNLKPLEELLICLIRGLLVKVLIQV